MIHHQDFLLIVDPAPKKKKVPLKKMKHVIDKTY